MGDRVPDCLGRDGNVVHADLVALIDSRRAAQGEQQHRRQACLCAAHPAGNARLIVVAENPVGPGAHWQRCFVCLNQGGNRTCAPLGQNQMEVERQVQAPPLDAVVGHQSLDRQIQLTDHQPVAITVRKVAKLVHDIHQLRPVSRVQMHA